jgi:hypothetical protein
LGIGDWGLGPIPNPQSPIPNPQSPIPKFEIKGLIHIHIIKYNNYNYNYNKMSLHKRVKQLNISKIKEDLGKNNPYNQQTIILINNRTNPTSFRQHKILGSESNSKKINYIKNGKNINKKKIKEKENINKDLEFKILKLEKEFKKRKEKYKTKIKLLKSDNKNKNNEIYLKTENKENNKNNKNNENNENKTIIRLKEKIEFLRKKINILSDENLKLLNEKKIMKNEIMSLRKDRQYLIEHITELNKVLNNRIKPKLNENESYLMNLKNQIIEFKNKNNTLIKDNILQNDIINDLKEELSDIYFKTTSLCKNNNNNYNIKKYNYSNNSKKFLSMQNIKDNNNTFNNTYDNTYDNNDDNEIQKNKKYLLNMNINNNTSTGREYKNSFYKIKDSQPNYNHLYKKNKINNIRLILDDFSNVPNQNNNVITKNENTFNCKTYNNIKNYKYYLKDNKELSNNSEKNYNIINNNSQNNYHFGNLTSKSKDINLINNKYEPIDKKYAKKNDSSNISFLSDYIDNTSD